MTVSKSWAMVVVGYSVLAAAMLAFLTVNGVSSTAVGTIGTAGLLGLGLVLPVVGMQELARRIDPSKGGTRTGLTLQSLCLIGILIGLLLSFFASSLPGHMASATFIALSGISGLVGAILISNELGARQLVLGAVLIAIGAALIPASNIASQMYWVQDLEKNAYQDIGATVAACGSVLAAYSCLVIRKPSVSR
jgi:hypothetical protein